MQTDNRCVSTAHTQLSGSLFTKLSALPNHVILIILQVLFSPSPGHMNCNVSIGIKLALLDIAQV